MYVEHIYTFFHFTKNSYCCFRTFWSLAANWVLTDPDFQRDFRLNLTESNFRLIAFWWDAFKEVIIRLKCAQVRLWSDSTAFDVVMVRLSCVKFVLIRTTYAQRGYDQTQLCSKLPPIRPKCARISVWSDFSDQFDLWSDHLQTIVQTVVRSNFRPDLVFLVWEHMGVRSTGSDHKPIWVWTSTWVCF